MASLGTGTLPGAHGLVGYTFALPEDAGQSDQPYPAGPYGVGVGAVVRNYSFEGYIDPSQGTGAAHHVAISLGNGKTIEAKGHAYGVGVFDAGNRFNYAGMIPGMS